MPLRRAIHLHARQPEISLAGRLVVAALALPFAAGALLAVARGAWTDALLVAGMILLAGFAASTGINLYARRRAHRGGSVPRGPLHPKRRGRAARR